MLEENRSAAIAKPYFAFNIIMIVLKVVYYYLTFLCAFSKKFIKLSKYRNGVQES